MAEAPNEGAGTAPYAKGMTAASAAVALSQVVVTFRLADGGTYPAVDRTSLAVSDGEFVAIVGPTGCGKSTLLNVAAGLTAPSSGRPSAIGKKTAQGPNTHAAPLFAGV